MELVRRSFTLTAPLSTLPSPILDVCISPARTGRLNIASDSRLDAVSNSKLNDGTIDRSNDVIYGARSHAEVPNARRKLAQHSMHLGNTFEQAGVQDTHHNARRAKRIALPARHAGMAVHTLH